MPDRMIAEGQCSVWQSPVRGHFIGLELNERVVVNYVESSVLPNRMTLGNSRKEFCVENSMQNVPVFLINLDRRTDRLAQMKAEFGAVGVEFERIPAVDALDTDEDLSKWRVDPRLPIGPAALCCMLSHFQVYRRILDDDIPLAMIAEDDIELSPDILHLLTSGDWLPDDIGLVQCESDLAGWRRVLVESNTTETPVPGRVLRRLHTRVFGSACYLITREAAHKIIASTKRALHIDMLMFDSEYSPAFKKLGVMLLMPSVAQQTYGVNSSDIPKYELIQGSVNPTIAENSLPPSHLSKRTVIYGRMLRVLSKLRIMLTYRLHAKAKGATKMTHEFRK